MRRVTLLLLVSVGWFLASAPPSEAAFVPGLVGNSGFTTTPGNAGGWINFAVYDNSGGGNWLDDLNLNSAESGIADTVVSGVERAVFFFQVVRDDTFNPDSGASQFITALDIVTNQVPWTGIGALVDTVFYESGEGAVGPLSNRTLGSEADPGEVSADGVLGDPAFVENSYARNLSSVSVDPFLGQFSWAPIDNRIGAEQFSSVFFLTSESDTDFLRLGTARTSLGGTGGPTAQVPITSPEPGSLILLSLAVVVGGAGYGWKRRKQKVAQQQ